MTGEERADYYPPVTAGWQHMDAFVIQFRPETDMVAGRFEGRVEHVATNEATRFHSLTELLAFIERVLAEVRDAAQ